MSETDWNCNSDVKISNLTWEVEREQHFVLSSPFYRMIWPIKLLGSIVRVHLSSHTDLVIKSDARILKFFSEVKLEHTGNNLDIYRRIRCIESFLWYITGSFYCVWSNKCCATTWKLIGEFQFSLASMNWTWNEPLSLFDRTGSIRCISYLSAWLKALTAACVPLYYVTIY